MLKSFDLKYQNTFIILNLKHIEKNNIISENTRDIEIDSFRAVCKTF